MTDILDIIRQKQHRITNKPKETNPHAPGMLYIGCVDARLDPIRDIGIEKGKALILRNVGAVVPPPRDANQVGGRSIGAALELFIQHMNTREKKHIVISGHTDCGGNKACLFHTHKESDSYLPAYLNGLEHVRNDVLQKYQDKGREVQLRMFEEASVRNSMVNLHAYQVVHNALEKNALTVHGWIIDTTTGRLKEMQPDGIFTWM